MNRTIERIRDACKTIAGAFTEAVELIDDLCGPSEGRVAIGAHCLRGSPSLLPCTVHVRIRTRLLKSGMYVAQIRRASNNAWIWSSPYCNYAFTAVEHARRKVEDMGWVTDAAPEFRHTTFAANACAPTVGCRRTFYRNYGGECT